MIPRQGKPEVLRRPVPRSRTKLVDRGVPDGVRLDDFVCPKCEQANIVTDKRLIGFCYGCVSYTGTSPWVPADGDGKCQQCSRPNAVWWIAAELWNAVMGNEGGVLCICCFIERAEAAGAVGRGAWQLYPPPG